MIKSDNQPTCSACVNKTGYNLLYDITEDADIDEGVILVAIFMGETYLFQLAKTVNILSDTVMEYISGSEIEYLEDPPGHIPMDYIPIGLVRYPTEMELEWYNKQNLI